MERGLQVDYRLLYMAVLEAVLSDVSPIQDTSVLRKAKQTWVGSDGSVEQALPPHFALARAL